MADADPSILEARAKLREKFGETAGSRLGGKGTIRRKKRVSHRPAAAVDDKKLQGVLKRLGLSTIPGIEEVTMLTSDKTYLHFANPRVQAAPSANTYVVSGHAETKDASQMPQFNPMGDKFGQEELMQMAAAAGVDPAMTKQLRELVEKSQAAQAAAGGAALGSKPSEGKVVEAADDDDVPELEENFDSAAGM